VSQSFAGMPVLVVGAGVSGEAAALALLAAGAIVTVTAPKAGEGTERLSRAGARIAIGLAAAPPGTSLVVTSPGLPPVDALLLAAERAGIEVIGEVELAWRLQPDNGPAWLALTGTNGKTTTVRMLESMLHAAGLRAVACGNVGLPITQAALATPPYEVLAVELSSFQLHRAPTVRPAASAVLNLAADHLDWHGSMDAYAQAKARIWAGGIAVGNADDPAVAAMLADAPGEHVTFTLGEPNLGQVGVVRDHLVDRAFEDLSTVDGPPSVQLADPATVGTVLSTVDEVRPAGPHNVANALAAAALARAYGVPPKAVRDGLRRFAPDRHRNELVATVRGVTYVNDSKATNPHAAGASLAAYPSVVWIAGGQLKGADVDELVGTYAPKLAGAVLLGQDRAILARAIARHAPDLPVIEVSRTDDGAMAEVVRAAARLAKAGDTVLLAPAGASWDMFTNYGARGAAFAAAVHQLGEAG
jgi:UDP-N-acetylmuramoylalanine--D-glutamate ligase